jgi:tRNA (cmo5U34)-methyltransferase
MERKATVAQIRQRFFQIDLLRQVGFAYVEILHKHSCFAAFGAIKG